MSRALRIGGVLLAVFSDALVEPLAAQMPSIPPIVLTLPASTRALGMGDAYVAMTADSDLIFYNPAQLISSRGLGIAAHRFDEATTLVTVSTAAALAPGAIAVGVQFLDHATAATSYADIATGGESALLVRGGALATGAVASVAYARPIKGMRIGVAAKAIVQELANERDATLAADVGIASGSTVQIALTGQHLGPGIELGDASVALPHRATLGAAVPRAEVGPFDVAVGLSFSYLRDGTFGGSAGTEWSYMPLDGFTFSMRAGVRALEDGGSRATFGAGFTGERFSFDWGFHPIGGDGSGQRLGIRWR